MTEQSLQRSTEVKIIYGNETTAKRLERSEASARLADLDMVGHTRVFLHGPRTCGRKPEFMNKAYPVLKALFRKLPKK